MNKTEEEGGLKHDALVSLAALGIVYGDIGTSPIYAFRECFFGSGHVAVTPPNVLGVLSLIVWALILTISIKYIVFVMSADNKGEGGIAALTALLNPWRARRGSLRYWLMLMGLFGAALLYGDGTITPAISVLSAMEGLEVASPNLEHYVLPITLTILVGLFWIQKRGTGGIGIVFGPVLAIWFLTIAILGIGAIKEAPQVLWALSPHYAVEFFINNGRIGFLVLGAAFLAVTGGEALYADMGHFGARPIRIAWFVLVLPALLLNYLGQGALLLIAGDAAHEPFYHLVPPWFLYPMIGLAAAATIIASQAVISGTFSLTAQLIHLGQLPRMNIVQTSRAEQGQIYIPIVNWVLMLATLALVLGFRTSSALASAYGIAVATTMVITSIIAFFVAQRFGFKVWLIALVLGPFLVIDVLFFGVNLLKFADGGWYPVLVAVFAYIVMRAWARGRELLVRRWGHEAKAPQYLAEMLAKDPVIRIPGTAVLLSPTGQIPPHFIRHLQRHRVLQEKLVIVSVQTEDEPRIPATERLTLIGIAPDITHMIVRYGFMQVPSVPVAIRFCERLGFEIDLDQITYYVGRETVLPSDEIEGMALWREHLFAVLSRNAMRATAFYGLPPDDVVELGFQVEI